MADEIKQTPPTNLAEYFERFAKNQKITGQGIGNVWMHIPCPFCAAADFMVYEIMDSENALRTGAKCKECERALGIGVQPVLHNGVEVGKSFVFAQTGGPDQPEWLKPQYPRATCAELAGEAAH
jgi:hypothetical protein